MSNVGGVEKRAFLIAAVNQAGQSALDLALECDSNSERMVHFLGTLGCRPLSTDAAMLMGCVYFINVTTDCTLFI